MSKAFKKFGKFIIGNLYRVKEYNKPDLSNGSYILCPNHVSDADGPVMWTHNDNIRILAKKECFQNNQEALRLFNKSKMRPSFKNDKPRIRNLFLHPCHLSPLSPPKL